MSTSSTFRIPFTCFLLLFFLCSRLCYAQSAQQPNCQDTMNTIIAAYNAGEWTVVKQYAVDFINHSNNKEASFFLYTRYRIYNYRDCEENLSKVYDYLIQSHNRLFEVDSAEMVYKQMLKRGLLKNESLEKDLGSRYRVNRFLLAGFAGITNPFNKANFKLGVQLGVGLLPLFIEMSYRDKYFNHLSGETTGGFGKQLSASPGKFPKYQFNFSGHEHLIEAVYNAKFPLRVSTYMPRTFFPYMCAGFSAGYYINSSVNNYEVIKINSVTDTVTYRSGPGRSLKKIDELNMDLTSMYCNRFSYGVFDGLGMGVILSKEFVLFAELRYYIGTNYRYKYGDFNSYRPGVNNFSFMIGLSRSWTTVRKR